MKLLVYGFMFTLLSINGVIARPIPTNSMPFDSVGSKWINGKLYVLHKVEPKQTWFALSRRYGTSVDEIKKANGGMEQLQTNAIVHVPYSRFRKPAAAKEAPKPVTPEVKTVTTTTSESVSTGTHKVEVGQTLYSIATKYGVAQSDIKLWNKLSSNNVVLGQELIVSAKRYQETQAAPKVAVTNTPDSTTVVAEKVIKPVLEPTVTSKEIATRSVKQNGLAEKIENGGGSTKYLALHRTAPIGSLIQVKNEVNSEVIWVKVIGRIPDTSINDDILIKLSGKAFDKVSPDTRRFRAEVVYSEPVK